MEPTPKQTRPHLNGQALPEESRAQLAELVGVQGESSAARSLGICRATIARAVAGARLRRGSVALLEVALRKSRTATNEAWRAALVPPASGGES